MEVHEIVGFQERSLRIVVEGEGSAPMALVFPGLRYPPARPLLHYSRKLLLSQGWAVAEVWYRYDLPDFLNAGEAERYEWLAAEAEAVWSWAGTKGKTGLALGKSLGSISMAHLANRSPSFEKLAKVWLTPLLTADEVMSTIARSKAAELLVAGEADPATPPQLLGELERPGRHLLLLAGADHSLETDDPFTSLGLLKDYLLALDAFLASL